jgi:hypothetical protein
MNKQELELKLKLLEVKWKDKPESVMYSKDWWQRKADRVLYRDYKSQLEKNKSGESNVVELAKQVFLDDHLTSDTIKR